MLFRLVQKKYEDYHHVKYTDAAIEAAANLSSRYIQDRFLPDKAIDLLDEAGSKMNLTLNFVDPKVIDQRLIEAENLKAQATCDEDFEKAAYFRDQIAKYKELQQTSVLDKDTPIISEKTIEHIVEQKTKKPGMYSSRNTLRAFELSYPTEGYSPEPLLCTEVSAWPSCCFPEASALCACCDAERVLATGILEPVMPE